MPTPVSIHYLSAYCGAGKTYALVRRAGTLAGLGRKVMIVQPTMALIEETMTKEVPSAKLPVTPLAITSKTYPNAVIRTLNDYLVSADDRQGGEIVFVTHSAFFWLPHFHGRQRWTIIIDEIPSVERHFTLNIPESHPLLTPHIEVTDKSDHRFWRIEPKGERLREMARNALGDQVLKGFEAFAATMASKHWEVFAHAQNYQRLLEGGLCAEVRRQLVASAIMSPQVFAHFEQVLIAGACFEESLLYLVWSRWAAQHQPVTFEPAHLPLRYHAHENGDLIDVYYAINEPFSKTVRSKSAKLKGGNEGEVLDVILGKAREIIGGERAAEFHNADIVGAQMENAERLPNVSHGLNSFTDIDHCVLLAAHNPSPAHFNFLLKFAEVESQEVHDALTHQNCYQALARTSIRDPENRNRKKVIVADLGTAAFLQRAFTSADGTKTPTVHHLDLFDESVEFGKVGRRRKHESPAARSAAYRDRKDRRELEVAIRLARVDILNGMPNVFSGLKSEAYEHARARLADRELLNLRKAAVRKSDFQGSLFRSKFEAAGQPIATDFDELVDVLKLASKMALAEKEDAFLWSPAHFVARPDVETERGLDNVAFARNVVLDFDGGDLTPDALAAILPELRIVAHSSWSNAGATPRFRVLIPTDGIVDVDGYKLLTGFVVTRLNEAGYWSADEIARSPKLAKAKTFRGTHGCDTGKLGPASLFYLPSLGANPTAAFFRDMSGHGRGPLRIRDWLASAPVPDLHVSEAGELRAPAFKPVSIAASARMMRLVEALQRRATGSFVEEKERRIEKALGEWSTNDRPGQRDKGMCALGVALRRAGCTEAEARQHLLDAASASRAKVALRSTAQRWVKTLYRN